MKKFIFITPEGETKAPKGVDIENLQVLGFGSGADAKDAFMDFIENSQYLNNTGFNNVVGIELAGDKQFNFLLK